jgi:HD-GYP domain-containing protein (c-di-GMP phosphodiesterase class II)
MDPAHKAAIHKEGINAYYAAPLLAKGQVIGVLEILHREPIQVSPAWLEIVEAFSGQAAIAIDNVTLFNNLQRSNEELMAAYDTTLEGWVRALEIRDRTASGHTQRVVEFTLDLARRLGVRDGELANLRRGALLHDVGNIGVPDQILQKDSHLTAEELEFMRCHPGYAYEMISPILYLRPAIDIPFCHHEWWDGSGYPRGLKGEEIPIAARIFSVVDVWDALTTDRPYRKAWSQEDAKAYLAKQSGVQFDPEIVRVFLAMI